MGGIGVVSKKRTAGGTVYRQPLLSGGENERGRID
jgi:hypothetical protein